MSRGFEGPTVGRLAMPANGLIIIPLYRRKPEEVWSAIGGVNKYTEWRVEESLPTGERFPYDLAKSSLESN